MAWIAADSFRSLQQAVLQANPVTHAELRKLGPTATTIFRRLTAEQNATWFETWETAQLVFGGLLFLYFLLGTRLRSFPLVAVLAMIAITVTERLIITPELVHMSRMSDISMIDPASGAARKFWLVHGGYIGLEVLKFGIGLSIALRFGFSQGRRDSDDARQKVDRVDKANYGHVNR